MQVRPLRKVCAGHYASHDDRFVLMRRDWGSGLWYTLANDPEDEDLLPPEERYATLREAIAAMEKVPPGAGRRGHTQ